MKEKIRNLIKKILLIITLAMCVIVLLALTNRKPTFADSGFGTSYSDGGSSSSSSGGSSSSYSSSRGDDSEGSLIIVIIVIIIIIYTSVKSKRKLNNTDINRTSDDEEIEKKIRQYIPDFNKEEFLSSGYKMYIDIQKAWMNFKLEDVKDIITDELYNMYESQLATLETKGEQNIMKDFEFQRSFLKDVSYQNETITITTGYIIDFYDYIVEQKTGKVLRGNENEKLRITYEMKFRKSLNEKNKVTKCPNCGAEIEMNTTGVCEYCRTKLVTDNTSWVLTEKKTVNQEYI